MSVPTGLTSGAVEVPIEIDGNGRFVVEGLVGEPGIQGPEGPAGAAGTGSTLSDNPFYWGSRNWVNGVSAPTGFYRIIYCSGFNLWIAAAWNGSNTNRIQTSPDGVNWTVRATFSAVPYGFAYSPSLNRVICTAGTNVIVYSNDGITWSNATSPSLGWGPCAWSPELGRFTALLRQTLNASAHCAYSSDGITWTSSSAITTPSVANLETMAWSPSLSKFVAVPFSNGNVLSSSDGITWTRTAIIDYQWRKVIWIAELSLFVAVSSNNNGIATSPDGTTWTLRSGVVGAMNGGIAYAPELGMVLVSTSSGLYVSANAINYTNLFNTQPTQNTPTGLFSLDWSPFQFRFCGGTETSFISRRLL